MKPLLPRYKKMMKKWIVGVLALASVSGSVSGQTASTAAKAKAEAQKVGKLKNLYKIDDGIYRSAQPGSDDFALFEKNGLKEVLNLRRLKDDKKKAKNTSLSLYHIPMKAGAIDQAEVMKALTLIRDRKGPILIHCWHGSDRTGMLCAMYRMVFQGWNKNDAVNEMTKGNFGFHSGYKNIVDFVRNADVDKYKKELFGNGKMIAAGAADSTTVSTIQ